MKIKYINKRFQQKTLSLIEASNNIIEDYQSRGYLLTLRQLYYRIIALDLFPDDRLYTLNKDTGKWYKDLENGTKNSVPNYKWLGTTIADGRDAGLVDWSAIVDRTRNRKGLTAWDNPQSILKAVSDQYRIDKWEDQDCRIFVWVEKEALAGVIQRACEDEDIQVDYLACRGYMSASTIWREAQKIADIYSNGQIPIILHLGDHDPSGIDMTRDNINRIQIYARLFKPEHFHFKRIALNWKQIEQYQPPPNPAKITDSRFNDYQAKYGNESFELDALDPDVLVSLIQNTINEYKDEDKWKIALTKEKKEKSQLKYLTKNWTMIAEAITEENNDN